MADCGYDVSDYCDIATEFGTLQDFDALIAEAHANGLKVILDYVPNHTSDRHPWFQQSRAARDDPKRDWYIWRDPAPDGGHSHLLLQIGPPLPKDRFQDLAVKSIMGRWLSRRCPMAPDEGSAVSR
jgi:glycosidase